MCTAEFQTTWTQTTTLTALRPGRRHCWWTRASQAPPDLCSLRGVGLRR